MNYHVYVLFTENAGVFYVGSGRQQRLWQTISEHRQRFGPSTRRHEYMRDLDRRGIPIKREVIFSTNDRREAYAVERFAIASYGSSLLNVQGLHTNWFNV